MTGVVPLQRKQSPLKIHPHDITWHRQSPREALTPSPSSLLHSLLPVQPPLFGEGGSVNGRPSFLQTLEEPLHRTLPWAAIVWPGLLIAGGPSWTYLPTKIQGHPVSHRGSMGVISAPSLAETRCGSFSAHGTHQDLAFVSL